MQSGRNWEDPAPHEEPHTSLFLTAVEAESRRSTPPGEEDTPLHTIFHHDCKVAFVCVATEKKLVFLQYYLNLNMYSKKKTYQKTKYRP